MVQKKKSIIRQLDLGYNYYVWQRAISLHVKSLGLYEHMNSGAEITVINENEDPVEL